MVEVALCLGSNSGDRRRYIRLMEDAVREMLLPPQTVSDLMETEPIDVAEPQPWFLNLIVGGRWDGSAFLLLDSCKSIERALGRTEKGTRRQRAADIDLLLFGDEVIDTAELKVPHPAILSRRFCIEGLNRIMPDATIGRPPVSIREHFRTMKHEVRRQGLRLADSEGGLFVN